MLPPEIVLDRFVKNELRNEPGFSTYLGKLDIEHLGSTLFKKFLYLVQTTMNEALRLENENASGGVEHPPFHFDYLDVSSEIRNALAFQHGGFAFIVLTLPLVELIWEVSLALSRSSRVLELLHLDPQTADMEVLHGFLFQIQLVFLVSHEYTHHVHRHGGVTQNGSLAVWTEFRSGTGNLHSQSQELNADGYAAYLVLANLLRGERRVSALAQWGRQDIQESNGDELLLTAFFLAVIAFFCELWRGQIDITSVYEFTHPPPPVRITYMIRVVQMWCSQNASLSRSWFTDKRRFQEFFHAAAEVIAGTDRNTWDAQLAFFRSAEGTEYDRRLLEQFDALRRGAVSDSSSDPV